MDKARLSDLVVIVWAENDFDNAVCIPLVLTNEMTVTALCSRVNER